MNVEKAYHIYRTDPESKLEINCAEDRTTGDSTIFVKLKSQNPNIVSKIKISEKQYSLTTYHQEYIGTSSKPISRPFNIFVILRECIRLNHDSFRRSP